LKALLTVEYPDRAEHLEARIDGDPVAVAGHHLELRQDREGFFLRAGGKRIPLVPGEPRRFEYVGVFVTALLDS
jgi:hypothetical protein